jgi:hypothetical protein
MVSQVIDKCKNLTEPISGSFLTLTFSHLHGFGCLLSVIGYLLSVVGCREK